MLIEQPPYIPELAIAEIPTVTSHLSSSVLMCENTVVENIDIRCHCKVATYCFDPCSTAAYLLSPDTVLKTPTKQCIFGHVTLQDVICEMQEYYSRLDKSKKNFPETTQQIFDSTLVHIKSAIQELIQKITKAKLAMDEQILPLSIDMQNGSKQDRRHELYTIIQYISVHLLDLHIFNRILSLINQRKKIALITGFVHAEYVKYLLDQLGAKQTATYGTKSCYDKPESFVPLNAAQLQLLETI